MPVHDEKNEDWIVVLQCTVKAVDAGDAILKALLAMEGGDVTCSAVKEGDSSSSKTFRLEDLSLCDNCSNVFVSEEENNLDSIPNLRDRLDPGGMVPSGECPLCGALAYPLEKAWK
jgi:hypothetical protein